MVAATVGLVLELDTMTSIGQLRTRMHIQQVTETRTPDGGIAEAWTPFAQVWAKVQGLRGRELFAAQQVQATTTHKVTIRYCRGLTSKHRMLIGQDESRVLNIESVVDVDEKHVTHELMCTEVSDG